MSIQSDIQKLDPGELITMYQLDLTTCGGSAIYYFHPGGTATGQDISYQGYTYEPWSVTITGMETTTKGTLPRPTAQIGDPHGLLVLVLEQYDDLIGATFHRIQTFARYLDGMPYQDWNSHFQVDTFYLERKASETGTVVTWELASAMDFEGQQIPTRVLAGNTCQHTYGDELCTYVPGGMWGPDDVATTDPTKDACSLRLSGCRLRQNVIHFGGAPGARMPV